MIIRLSLSLLVLWILLVDDVKLPLPANDLAVGGTFLD